MVDLTPRFASLLGSILGVREYFEWISDYLTLPEVVNASLIRPRSASWVAGYTRKKLRTILARYSSDPDSFLHCLRMTGGAITGSTYIDFLFNNNGILAADLDIVTPSSGEEALTTYLTSIGYTAKVKGVSDYPLCDSDTVKKVVGFSKPPVTVVDPDDPEKEKILVPTRYIDLVVSFTESIASVISSFHSSAPQGWVSADELVSFYPQHTLASVSVYQESSGAHYMDNWRLKYVSREFSVVLSTDELPIGEACGELCPNSQRNTFDDHIFSISFSSQPTKRDSINFKFNEPQGYCSNPSCPTYDAHTRIAPLLGQLTFMQHGFDALQNAYVYFRACLSARQSLTVMARLLHSQWRLMDTVSLTRDRLLRRRLYDASPEFRDMYPSQPDPFDGSVELDLLNKLDSQMWDQAVHVMALYARHFPVFAMTYSKSIGELEFGPRNAGLATFHTRRKSLLDTLDGLASTLPSAGLGKEGIRAINRDLRTLMEVFRDLFEDVKDLQLELFGHSDFGGMREWANEEICDHYTSRQSARKKAFERFMGRFSEDYYDLLDSSLDEIFYRLGVDRDYSSGVDPIM